MGFFKVDKWKLSKQRKRRADMKEIKASGFDEKPEKKDEVIKTVPKKSSEGNTLSKSGYTSKPFDFANSEKDKQKSDQINVKPEDIEDEDFFNQFKKSFNTFKKKLTIIFIENTKEVLKEKETIIKVVKALVKSGYVYIINYGLVVTESQIIEVSKFDYNKIMLDDKAGDDSCLYDALLVLESVIYEKLNHTIESQDKINKITNIEVIGFGRCIDKGSSAPKEIAMDYFRTLTQKKDVTIKYFCLTEDSFIDAAEIGFRSIGAMNRKFN